MFSIPQMSKVMISLNLEQAYQGFEINHDKMAGWLFLSLLNTFEKSKILWPGIEISKNLYKPKTKQPCQINVFHIGVSLGKMRV